jgi:hypothetical protein
LLLLIKGCAHLQGARSPEELALCRALADFHNLVRIRDPPIRAEDISSSDHTFVLQLYNVRPNLTHPVNAAPLLDDCTHIITSWTVLNHKSCISSLEHPQTSRSVEMLACINAFDMELKGLRADNEKG